MRNSTLEEFRASNGISRMQMAKLIGVRMATVWKWERGTATPRRAHLMKIREVTHGAVTPNEFLTPTPPLPDTKPASQTCKAAE